MKKLMTIMMAIVIAVTSFNVAPVQRASAEEAGTEATTETPFDPTNDRIIFIDGQAYGTDANGKLWKTWYYDYTERYTVDAYPTFKQYNANGELIYYNLNGKTIYDFYADYDQTGCNGYEGDPDDYWGTYNPKCEMYYRLHVNKKGNMVFKMTMTNNTKKKVKYEIGKTMYIIVESSKYKLPKLVGKKFTLKGHKSKTFTVVIKKSALKGKLKRNGGKLFKCNATIHYDICGAGVDCCGSFPIGEID